MQTGESENYRNKPKIDPKFKWNILLIKAKLNIIKWTHSAYFVCTNATQSTVLIFWITAAFIWYPIKLNITWNGLAAPWFFIWKRYNAMNLQCFNGFRQNTSLACVSHSIHMENVVKQILGMVFISEVTYFDFFSIDIFWECNKMKC